MKSSITNFQLDLFKNLPLIVRKNSKHKNIYLACDDRNIKEEVKKNLKSMILTYSKTKVDILLKE